MTSISFPRLRLVQTLVTVALWTSAVALGLLATLVWYLDHQDRLNPALQPAFCRRRHALRQLTFTTTSAWSAVLTRQSWEESPSPPLAHQNDSTISRLDRVFALIKSSFILPWYERISPSPAIPNTIELLIRHILADIVKRGQDTDWSALLVSRLLPAITTHIHHFRTIEHLSSTLDSSTLGSALPLPLPAKTHPALSQGAHSRAESLVASIEEHIRGAIGRVLGKSLPENSQSVIVKTLMGEILLGAIVMPALDSLSDGDFWNWQMEEKGGKYLHEQKQVNKFLSALSSLPSTATTAQDRKHKHHSHQSDAVPTFISSSSSTRQFETFLRSISRVKTVGEARRLRADIEREHRIARKFIDDTTSIDAHSGEQRLEKRYIKRLDRAKLEVEARINTLSRQSEKPTEIVKSPQGNTLRPETASTATMTLLAVLSDPSSLAYWLEHMERRGRSRLVQFWLTVEGFKDPLDSTELGMTTGDSGNLPSFTGSLRGCQTLGGDLAFLHATYFTASDGNLEIPSRHLATIKELIAVPSASLDPHDILRGKQAMFVAQEAVYEQMKEEDWDAFRRSELYQKAASDLSRSQPQFSRNVSASQSWIPFVPKPPGLPRQVTEPIISARDDREVRPGLSPFTRPTGPLRSGSSVPASPLAPPPVIYVKPLPSRSTFEPRLQTDRRVSGEDSASSYDMSSPATPAHSRSSQLGALMNSELVEEPTKDRLFVDDADEEITEDEEEDPDLMQVQTMEAIQAALDTIIATDDQVASGQFARAPSDIMQSPSSSVLRSSADHAPPARRLASRSVENFGVAKNSRQADSAPHSRVSSAQKPLLAHRSSLSKLVERPNGSLFEDTTEAGLTRSLPNLDDQSQGLLQLAGPGNLRLTDEITRLERKLQELVRQEHLLNSLVDQAELTGNQEELRILQQSQISIRREQRTAIFQKVKCEQSEEESRLVPGRTRINIPSTVTSTDSWENHKQVVRYTIVISQTSGNDITTSWSVSKRYNEFWNLDRAIRDWAVSKFVLRGVLDLPPKKLVTNMSSSAIDTRRAGLERYMQSLLGSEDLCASDLLRDFLSRATSDATTTPSVAPITPHHIVRSLYKTMTTIFDEQTLAPSMLELMSTTLNRHLNDLGEMMGISGEELAGLRNGFLPQVFRASWTGDAPIAGRLPVDGGGPTLVSIPPVGCEPNINNFATPICDLFVEIFDLRENNWLRRQAIVVIMQQLLGGTIERKLKDVIASALSSESADRLLGSFQEFMWPKGTRRPPSTPRTEEEKADTRLNASRSLGVLMPDIAASMVGRGNAQRAARRVFGALQDKRLNQHLLLCLLDEVLAALYPPSP